MSDIFLSKYQEAIEHSIIFKDDSGAIDISLTNSIFKLLEIRIYMTDEFIFKCGSHSMETYIILEGQAMLVGACQGKFFKPLEGEVVKDQADVIAVMKSGSHFGTDLSSQPIYGFKKICHLVSRRPTIVGIISHDNLHLLYNSYPIFKEKLQQLNKFTFEKCERNFDHYDTRIKEELMELDDFEDEKASEEQIRLIYIQKQLTYSKETIYNRILGLLAQYEEDHCGLFQEQHDLIILQKMFYYGQEGKAFPIFDNEYQEAKRKQSHESMLLQMLAGNYSKKQNHLNKDVLEKERAVSKCLSFLQKNFYFKVNSKGRHIISSLQIINLFYIALSTPYIVGFSIQMTSELNFIESISIAFSAVWILFNFRTQVIIKGVPSLEF